MNISTAWKILIISLTTSFLCLLSPTSGNFSFNIYLQVLTFFIYSFFLFIYTYVHIIYFLFCLFIVSFKFRFFFCFCMLFLFCDIRACLFLLDEGSCYIFSTWNNCSEFLASHGVNLLIVHRSFSVSLIHNFFLCCSVYSV